MNNLQYNRIATQDDFLKQTNEVRDERRDVPLSDILDAPLYCLRFNEDWKSHIIGAVATLQTWTAWTGDDDDTNIGSRQISKFLAQDMTDCGSGDCTIETLLADDEFFQTEYLPKTLGTKYSNSQTRNDDLETAYDTTPQSIGAEIPTSTPDDEEKNALCAALMRFVKLYCSEKICIIQSRNFLEIAYDSLEDAAESFYGSTLDQMLGNWSDNLFGCIVDVPTALTALADETAQEDLACFLLDELDGSAISESAFNTAIDNAATSLSGNEQAIACVMSEDYALSLALNFFQAYNTALLQSAAGDEVDCPCITESYRVWKWDFANGLGEFIFDWSGSTQLGELYAGGIQGPSVDGTGQIQIRRPFNPTWRIKGMRVRYSRTHGGSCIMRWRPTPNSNTGALNPTISNGLVVGDNEWACQNDITVPLYTDGLNEILIAMLNSNNSAGAYMRIHEIEILYVDGYHEGGYPTSDDDLCT